MVARAIELDLPLGESPAFPRDVAGTGRHDHLLALPGVDEAAAARLARAFPTLAAVYAADLDRLTAAVGPVAAARIRWFLDAPLSAAALPGRRPGRRPGGWRSAA